MSGCKFCQIVAGELAADLVGETEAALVFLDYRPWRLGHCLVVPRFHWETIAEVPAEELGPLFTAVQLTARAIETGLAAEGTFVAINNRVSQSVPHLHVHVVPRRRGDGLKGFFWPREKYRDRQQQEDYRRALREAFLRLQERGSSGRAAPLSSPATQL
ncbi:MAG: HIT family protein [Bryobacterales bacterium]|nr:HIT family protein [Bryobacteraceae bacterium]MDW8131400.1 HIT family protein [Bryobacterales bacterium]